MTLFTNRVINEVCRRNRYSFDPKCFDLAEHFLAERANVTAEMVCRLAQDIQDAVESSDTTAQTERKTDDGNQS
jgi:hypothetical protein